MVKALVTALILFLNTMLQTVIFPKIDILGIAPDTLLILCVSIGVLGGGLMGMWTGLAGGLLIDMLFGTALGYNALVYMLVGYAAGLLRERFNTDNNWLPPLIAAVAYLAKAVVDMLAIYFVMRLGFGFWIYLGRYILPTMLITGASAFPLHILLRQLFKQKFMRRRKQRPTLEKRLTPLE
ncbi:MAG: rod shape-determining protein MreD [Bacillota bacterium]|nr:rod shape-determining protein MreD [Bacillota bacterium]